MFIKIRITKVIDMIKRPKMHNWFDSNVQCNAKYIPVSSRRRLNQLDPTIFTTASAEDPQYSPWPSPRTAQLPCHPRDGGRTWELNTSSAGSLFDHWQLLACLWWHEAREQQSEEDWWLVYPSMSRKHRHCWWWRYPQPYPQWWVYCHEPEAWLVIMVWEWWSKHTFLPKSAIDFSIPTKSSASVFRTTGVTRPFSVATATLIST